MMTNWTTALHTGAAQLNITISAQEEALFTRYLELLLERNRVMNLTAITDPVDVARKHFIDSLAVEQIWHPAPGNRAIDIGTGAGFPGIPLSIRHPDVTFVLNDSVRKKVDFLQDVINTLTLKNASALWSRAETLGRDPQHRGKYHTTFARAVAHLGALAEYSLPLLVPGGVLIAMKGPGGEQEIRDSEQALSLIGGKVTKVKSFELPDVGERVLIVIKKIRTTPDSFPRDPGAARKKPLYIDSRRGTP